MLTDEQRYKMILRDYGYKLVHHGEKWQLVQTGLAGYYADRLLSGKHNSAMAAAESLIPIIHEDEYQNRVQSVGFYLDNCHRLL